ncbi:hypothetical protein HUA74_12450 [Myxococcus sp. CA051A]|uniref:hypothetical protein n=1 Tax=unclassified Myxococcus TaxID=2648731 RepID=UPI00157B7AD5|nr:MULTISPECIES: hypothetical protein [unclassified Myxococcus]NTX15415.1 hypothetical protein [Myxococcus sp. CA056]NTX39622.1 hypothetical protein [Myxococcus sp. CA033]NTX61481.1 hypothetical protein [Myxococcus sp. CA051A]
MRFKMRSTSLVLSLTLLAPLGASAQFDDGEVVLTAPTEPERGCPKRPDLVPFTPRAQVGMEGSGWLVHQAIIPESKDTFFKGRERERSGVKRVPEEEVRRLGAPDPTIPLWVFGKADTAACRAVPVSWWAARMGATDVDRKTFLMAEIEVDCDVLPPGRLSGTPVALRQKDEPTGCKLRRPTERETGKDGEGLPPDVLEFIPVRDCESPECMRLWERIGASWDDSTTVGDFTVSWMERKGKKDPCDWPTEDLSLLLYRPPGALTPALLRNGGTQFFGGLHDSAGLRFVLSRDLGSLYMHEAAKPKAAPKAVRYGSPTEEDLILTKRTLSPCKVKR